MGFQRDNIPLVGSRADSPCRVWDSVPQGIEAIKKEGQRSGKSGEKQNQNLVQTEIELILRCPISARERSVSSGSSDAKQTKSIMK